MPSAKDQAKRALVSLLKSLAATYAINAGFTRDFDDKDLICLSWFAGVVVAAAPPPLPPLDT